MATTAQPNRSCDNHAHTLEQSAHTPSTQGISWRMGFSWSDSISEGSENVGEQAGPPAVDATPPLQHGMPITTARLQHNSAQTNNWRVGISWSSDASSHSPASRTNIDLCLTTNGHIPPVSSAGQADCNASAPSDSDIDGYDKPKPGGKNLSNRSVKDRVQRSSP